MELLDGGTSAQQAEFQECIRHGFVTGSFSTSLFPKSVPSSRPGLRWIWVDERLTQYTGTANAEQAAALDDHLDRRFNNRARKKHGGRWSSGLGAVADVARQIEIEYDALVEERLTKKHAAGSAAWIDRLIGEYPCDGPAVTMRR